MTRGRGTRGWWATVGPALAVIDPAAVAVAALLSVPHVGWGPVVLAAEAAFLVTLAAGRQRSRLALSLLRDLPVLGLAAVAAAATLVLASDVLALNRLDSWVEAGAMAALLFIALTVARGVVYGVARLLRGTRRFARGVVIVGTGEEARRLAEELAARPDLGLVPVGFVDCGQGTNPRGLPLPFLGGLAALPAALAETDGDDVVFCCGVMPDDETADLLRECLSPPTRVFVGPGRWQREAPRGRLEQVGGVRLLLLSGWPPRRSRRSERHRRTQTRDGSAPAPVAHQSQVHAGQVAG